MEKKKKKPKVFHAQGPTCGKTTFLLLSVREQYAYPKYL